MRNIISTFIVALFASISFATEIEVTIVFENLTNNIYKSGEFTIIDLNKTIPIYNTQSFKITLPQKGKYQFSFVSNDLEAYTIYPVRINKNNNTITIQLKEKNQLNSGLNHASPINLETNLTDEQIEERIAKGTLNFIIHAIDGSIPEEYIKFKEKYGIGLIKENCAMHPMSFNKANLNNRMIFNYLNRIYGTDWLNELKVKPLGIK